MKWFRTILKWTFIGLTAVTALLLISGQLWHTRYNNPQAFIQYDETALAAEGIQFIEANGLRFAYLEAGEGPLVLLIHGFPDSAHGYEPTMTALAEAGYHAVAYFQRGYAPTEIPADGDYTPLTLGQDVIALIDAFGAESAIIVGHDWGATAAYAAANQAPDRIEKMVTLSIPHPQLSEFSPELLQRAPHFVQLQFGFLSEWLVRHNEWAYLDRLITYWSPDWDAEVMLAQTKADFAQPGRLQAALGYYRNLSQSQDQLPTLQQETAVPTLTFIGRDDGPLAISDFDNSKAAYSGYFQLIIVDDAGHFVHQEAPDAFITDLLQFLQSEL